MAHPHKGPVSNICSLLSGEELVFWQGILASAQSPVWCSTLNFQKENPRVLAGGKIGKGKGNQLQTQRALAELCSQNYSGGKVDNPSAWGGMGPGRRGP